MKRFGMQRAVGPVDQTTRLSPAERKELARTIVDTATFDYGDFDVSYVNVKQSKNFKINRKDHSTETTVSDWGAGVTKAVVCSYLLNSTAYSILKVPAPDVAVDQQQLITLIDRMDDNGALMNHLPMGLDLRPRNMRLNFKGFLFNADKRTGVDFEASGGRIRRNPWGFNYWLPHTSALAAYAVPMAPQPGASPSPAPASDASLPFWVWIIIGVGGGLALLLLLGAAAFYFHKRIRAQAIEATNLTYQAPIDSNSFLHPTQVGSPEAVWNYAKASYSGVAWQGNPAIVTPLPHSPFPSPMPKPELWVARNSAV